MAKFTPIILPQPGEDLRTWARQLTSQLQALSYQLQSAFSETGRGVYAPIYTANNTLVLDKNGYYIDGMGRAVVTPSGLKVYDLSGFPVIDGPHVYINTEHLVDNAVNTAKLAAGAVTEVNIDDDAITAPKLQANSVVAGKLAANAIVANDGVIGVAAIASAQIAYLEANKITAGDIAAERMSANIVTALTGKFATLSALAAQLGAVQITSGGALFTQGVGSYTAGTGFWVGEHSGAYKLRIGNPAGARLQWTGGALEIYNSANELTIASGDIHWTGVVGASKPEDNATRNVFRGDWTFPEVYAKGDIVFSAGNSWTALLPHTSAAVNAPPESGTGNTWWGLYGAKGEDGAPGPAVVVTGNRPLNFTATDGVLDPTQPNIVLTAEVFDLASAAYVWTFLGFETSPVSSGTNVQTITMAQFGTSRAASVTCTVNGLYASQVTIVRAERSTAEAGATVGADDSNYTGSRGNNLLRNSMLKDSTAGWGYALGPGGTLEEFRTLLNENGAPKGYGALKLSFSGTASSVYESQVYCVDLAVPCVPGERMELGARVGVYRGDAQLTASFLLADGSFMLYVPVTGGVSEATNQVAWTQNLSDLQHLWGFVTAPTNAVKCYMEVRVKRTTTAAPTDLYIALPYIGKAGSAQIVYSPWNQGAFITPSEVTTWIADLAVQRAQIGYAAVGFSQIGDLEVGTLKIAGNAVTVPLSASGADLATVYSNTEPFTIFNLTGDYNTTARLLFIGHVNAHNTGSSGRVRVRFVINGSWVIYDGFAALGPGMEDAFMFSTTADVSSGVHSFQMQIGQNWGGGPWNCVYASFAVWGTKK